MSYLKRVLILAAMLALPVTALAQGKIAVVNLEAAILQTDYAQARLEEVRSQEDYRSDKAEYDRLNEEFEEMVTRLQNDAAVMSKEQQLEARKKLASKQSDLEYVTGKLQKAEQSAGQELLQELSPKVQEVLRELINTEGIGLLLQRNAVIHADPGYSITAKVTDKLNQITAQ